MTEDYKTVMKFLLGLKWNEMAYSYWEENPSRLTIGLQAGSSQGKIVCYCVGQIYILKKLRDPTAHIQEATARPWALKREVLCVMIRRNETRSIEAYVL